jgi:hypothetical protein
VGVIYCSSCKCVKEEASVEEKKPLQACKGRRGSCSVAGTAGEKRENPSRQQNVEKCSDE